MRLFIILFFYTDMVYADIDTCLNIKIELSANMISNGKQGSVFWKDDIRRILCKNTNAKVIEEKKRITTSKGGKKLLLKVSNKNNCKFEVLFYMNEHGKVMYADTENRDCNRIVTNHSQQIGDTVYMPGEWLINGYYYSQGSVEDVRGNKVRISITQKCWWATPFFRQPEVVCNNEDNGEFRAGNYYWVNESSLVNRVPEN